MKHLTLLAISTIAILGLTTLTPAMAEAQQRGFASGASAVTFQVPSIVKLVVDDQTRTADGAPLIRVGTNDPGIRAAAANGVTPEVLRLAGVGQDRPGHAKGGEAGEATIDGLGVVRYTIVQP
jgi:hypothetical protein